MPQPAFVHLRLHTEFSVVDGTNRVEDIVKAAAADAQPELAYRYAPLVGDRSGHNGIRRFTAAQTAIPSAALSISCSEFRSATETHLSRASTIPNSDRRLAFQHADNRDHPDELQLDHQRLRRKNQKDRLSPDTS